MKIVANTRKTQGSGASRRLRRADKLPGILYGGSEQPTLIALEHNPIFFALKKEKFHASILTMELDGKDELCVLRDFQLHPYKPQVLHIDFQRVNPNEPVVMSIPLHFYGQENSPAVKIDKALINRVLSAIEVSCLPKDLPEFVDVDLSGLTAHDTLRVLDIKLPEGVKAVVRANSNPPVVTVVTDLDDDEDTAAADTTAAAAAPAAGAAAPAAGAAAAPAAGAAAAAPAAKK